jgi:SPP1 gp7 family putative phage head morphogenesis protein
VGLITSIPQKYFSQLQEVVQDQFVEGMRWEDMVEMIEHVGDVTESRAKLIARDQTSKMNSSFNEARQTSVGIEEYEWQTAGDERVRETHADNDGERFRWDDPPDETGHPGHDVNCRCTAIPYFDLDAEEAALDEA